MVKHIHPHRFTTDTQKKVDIGLLKRASTYPNKPNYSAFKNH